MKIPLRFQITEFDCGTVSLQNAISYLFERENIPAELVRAIALYTMDCYDENGNLGQGGTSVEAIGRMTTWIDNYTKKHDFKVVANHYIRDEVNVEVIKACINAKGCVLLRTSQEVDHYVLVTGLDGFNVYVWDPYYLDENYYSDDDMVKIIFDKPFDYNRVVKMDRFNDESYTDFSLGPINKRECVCFYRK